MSVIIFEMPEIINKCFHKLSVSVFHFSNELSDNFSLNLKYGNKQLQAEICFHSEANYVFVLQAIIKL